MLGAIIGDIVGSAYEFKNHRSKAFDPFFHPDAKFTDDTVCTVAIADALIQGTDPTSTMQTWCRRYAENGGWGQRFALWIFEDNPQPYGSWGNGAAMRISPVGLLAGTEEEVVQWADSATTITHNHPEAIASARAVALAIFWARRGITSTEIAAQLTQRFGYDLSQTPDDIRPAYKRTERASGSVPQAIVCALQSISFEDAIRNAVSIGGDSDTIAAIAGGIAEARFGIPEEFARHAWEYLPQDIRAVVNSFYAALTSD
jgi:ADP-ribosylglycohydrolase